MAAEKTGASESGASKRVVSSFPLKQWERFEAICQAEAGMDARQALKYLVADSAVRGRFPISRATDDAELPEEGGVEV